MNLPNVEGLFKGYSRAASDGEKSGPTSDGPDRQTVALISCSILGIHFTALS